MKARDLIELLALAALWGGSFLLMRLSASEFGPVALAATRVTGASFCLLPLLLWRGEWPALRQHWRTIAWVGLLNSALPFLCYGLAALAITGGLASIFNASTPLWGALIAWWWLNERPDLHKTVGLGLGFLGVAWLAGDQAGLRSSSAVSPAVAVAACLAATFMYGLSANATKRYLSGVPTMALAAGSQLSAALLLLPMAWLFPPAQMPSPHAWAAALALALLCTGLAYVLYFRLIARLGASQAMSVTFLIPAFGVLWGALFLHESITLTMVLACGVILLGTALVNGLLRPR